MRIHALLGLALATGALGCTLPPSETNAELAQGVTGQDLALNKTAAGSTPCNSNETPAKAFNGSVSGGNSDKWCSSASFKFLEVDLGADMNVNGFILRHAGAGGESTSFNTRDFTIQTSLDGTTFTNVVSVTSNTASVTTHDIAPRIARFVRLTISIATQTTSGTARIYEFEVYGTPNLALNKPAAGSTPCNSNETPDKAFNGSVSGGNSDKWCSPAATKFLQVDLGAIVPVGRFVLRHAGAGGESTSLNTRAFNIQTSVDGTIFVNRVLVTSNTASVSTHDITRLDARYVRLNVTVAAQNTSSTARIYEFEVHGG